MQLGIATTISYKRCRFPHWTSAACEEEVIAKDKVEFLTTFVMYDLSPKIEFTEDLDSFFGTSNAKSRSHVDEQLYKAT